MAALAGPGLDSMKLISISGRYRFLHFAGAREIVFEAGVDQ